DPYPFMSWNTRLLPFLEQANVWRNAQQAFAEDSRFLDNPPHGGLATIMPVYSCPADVRTLALGRLREHRPLRLTHESGGRRDHPQRAAATGRESVMANADEPLGQDVEQEPADELVRGQPHHLGRGRDAAIALGSPNECRSGLLIVIPRQSYEIHATVQGHP